AGRKHPGAHQLQTRAGDEPGDNASRAALEERVGSEDDIGQFLGHTTNQADGAAGAAPAGGGVALPPRILNMTVPQVGHLPLIAFRPFFMVSSTASVISFLALHLTQYPSGIRVFLPGASSARPLVGGDYEPPAKSVNW